MRSNAFHRVDGDGSHFQSLSNALQYFTGNRITDIGLRSSRELRGFVLGTGTVKACFHMTVKKKKKKCIEGGGISSRPR